MRYKEKSLLMTVVLFLMILFILPVAIGETTTWDCPKCGRTDNTGNYCGGCAHPAPWLTNEISSAFFGFNLPADVDQQAKSLFEQAKTWNEENAPQTIDSFPLLPESVFQLYNSIKANKISLEKKDSQYFVTTSIFDIVSGWPPPYQIIQLGYDDRNRKWHTADLTQIDDYTFSFSLLEGMDIDGALLDWQYIWDVGTTDWQESLLIRYKITNGRINDYLDVTIHLINYSNSDVIEWWLGDVYSGYDKNTITISINSSQRGWRTLEYDIKTGKLIKIYDHQ